MTERRRNTKQDELILDLTGYALRTDTRVKLLRGALREGKPVTADEWAFLIEQDNAAMLRELQAANSRRYREVA